MAEGEGTTPGAYGAASDFWEGWSDHDQDGEGETSRGATPSKEGGADYWDRYGQEGHSALGEEDDEDEDEDVLESPTGSAKARRRTTIRATASPLNVPGVKVARTNGTHEAPSPLPADTSEKETSGLRLALEGVWTLYASAGWSAEKRDLFVRIAEQVSAGEVLK